MTNQEASEIIKDGMEDMSLDFADEEQYEALTMAIKALEKEPSGDFISRQAVMDCIDGYSQMIIRPLKLKDYIDELTPVNPQEPKTGKWITWKEAGNEISSETKFECSVCHDVAQTLCNGLDLLSPFCPNCGAKMVEQQESEGV